ncbi:MAG: BRO family protein [Xenococcaceae cyanobacterium MO_207.B15]|nr:BRO family protein [Xenococcaceae cyanobacterium MO_207.B15]
MSNLSIFTFESQQVRFVGTAEKPEWIAVDLCNIFGIRNVSDTLAKFSQDEKGVAIIDTLGGEQSLLTLTEPGLYRLIFKSRKDIAKRFQRWVFHEVLPEIRKTGSYSIQQETPPSTPSLPSAKERLETICMGMDLLERLGGCDQRTEVQLKDQIRNILLADKLQPSSTEITTTQVRLEYPVSDRSVSLGYRPNNGQLQQIGKQASRLYQERHGTKPIQREQFVGGATRMVNVYGFNDLDLLDQAILSVMDK